MLLPPLGTRVSVPWLTTDDAVEKTHFTATIIKISRKKKKALLQFDDDSSSLWSRLQMPGVKILGEGSSAPSKRRKREPLGGPSAPADSQDELAASVQEILALLRPTHPELRTPVHSSLR